MMLPNETFKSLIFVINLLPIFRFILLGFGPFSVLLWLNGKIYFQMSRMSGLKQERHYSIILLLIVVMFLICHSPRLFLNIYEAVEFDHVAQCGSPPIWVGLKESCLSFYCQTNERWQSWSQYF